MSAIGLRVARGRRTDEAIAVLRRAPLTRQQLADRLGVSLTNVTTILRGIADRGLLVTVTNDERQKVYRVEGQA